MQPITGNTSDKIGIIAGGGQFPFLFAKAVHKQGLKVYAAAHKGETDAALVDQVDSLNGLNLASSAGS
jgi:DUF1009 family protein